MNACGKCNYACNEHHKVLKHLIFTETGFDIMYLVGLLLELIF